MVENWAQRRGRRRLSGLFHRGHRPPDRQRGFDLCCRYGQAPLSIFIPCILWTLCRMTLIGPAASCGVGTHRLQRPSLRAGSNAHHPMLSTPFDDRWKACGRRPISMTACCARPEMQRATSTGPWIKG